MIKNLMNFIKKEYTEETLNISTLISELKNQIEVIIHKISLEEDKEIYISELTEIAQNLEDIKNDLDINFGQLSIVEIKNEDINEEEKLNPHYKNYRVETTEEHSLLEDLTFARPFGFKFVNGEFYEARTWKDVFIMTCEILYKINEKKFMSFQKLTKMNGNLRDYFSTDKKNMISPVKIMDKIYITTSKSANGYSKLIEKMLKEYDYDIDDYKLYYIADYSPLHK